MSIPTLDTALGFLFETGFNMGCLTTMAQQNIKHPYEDYFSQQLARLQLPAMVVSACRIAHVLNENEVKQWVHFALWQGWVSGYTFFDELLDALVPRKYSARRKQLVIRYFQARFANDNSLKTVSVDRSSESLALLSPLFPDPNEQRQILDMYDYKGAFLRADLLVLVQCPSQKPVKSPEGCVSHLIALDASRFANHFGDQIRSLQSSETWRTLMQQELAYVQNRSAFAALSVDSSPTTAIEVFPEGLRSYISLFARYDKESSKLIQAGSYVNSFFECLRRYNKLLPQQPIIAHAIGYSSRGANAITISQQNPDDATIPEAFDPCTKVYTQGVKSTTADEKSADYKSLLRFIRRNASKSFEPGFDVWLESIQPVNPAHQDSSNQPAIFQETVSGFFNTAADLTPEQIELLRQQFPSLMSSPPTTISLRDAHAECLRYALTLPNIQLVFATGNPGIGKTTALVQFLRDEIANGFLLLYASPRTQVNRDLWQKFIEGEQVCHDDLVLLTSDSNLIQNHDGEATILFRSNVRQSIDFPQRTVTKWIDASEQDTSTSHRSRRTARSVAEGTIVPTNQTSRGVLYSLCHGLGDCIAQGTAHALVATVAIQALKETHNGSTLDHIKQIFKCAIATNTRKETYPIEEQMRAIAQRMRTLVFMLDEVTGDEAGVAFLHDILGWVRTLRLQEFFRVKIVVADASITEADIITTHLERKDPEQDKIYYRGVETSVLPIRMHRTTFLGESALVINANSYPARSLDISYRVFSEIQSVEKMRTPSQRASLENAIQFDMKDVIANHLVHKPLDQMLVYLQDKQRLTELMQTLGKFQQQRSASWEEGQDYLVIHADTTDVQRDLVESGRKTAKVVFMTASASRGLSFPSTTHIVVGVPRFALEQNLMEIIQVIYRGRGDRDRDQQPKSITFYLGERTVYSDQSMYEQKRVEVLLNIATMLVALKTVIMTRIRGEGMIGKTPVALIPIGGKAVTAAGETLSETIAGLQKQISKQLQQQPADKDLRSIQGTLGRIMGTSDTSMARTKQDSKKKSIKGRTREEGSYLDLCRPDGFQKQFLDTLSPDFSGVLRTSTLYLEKAFVQGGLLLVPTNGREMSAHYHVRTWNELLALDGDLLRSMRTVANKRRVYPETLCVQVKKTLDLLQLLELSDGSTQYHQRSRSRDQFYAIPLVAFVARDAMETYFAQSTEDEHQTFRTMLGRHVNTLYQVDGLLPVGKSYADVPFVLFRSSSIPALRRRLFLENHIVSSHLFNLLLVMLSQKSD